VNLTTLPAGKESSVRHFHSREDELVGTHDPEDLVTCTDVDLALRPVDGHHVHKDGTPS
jgi:uncharacterized cupin superfamily protein